ncbi:FkbM family methyltransferase [Actinoplanes sp. URMC 104]|uniref:FkbM family methyltransferase n=1 Tax=Actinoplanes sp. URMC 104 TaxID=3423409 RepID=UPI003F1942BF
MTDIVRPRSAVIADLLADPAMAPLHRSLRYYYGDADRDAALDRLYGQFVRPRDLVFDIGAHVGDRIASFRRLGARVIAIEPQPLCVRALRQIFAGDNQVRVIQAACGAEAGILPLHVNSANPTVSTLSENFVSAADGAGGWESQTWDEVLTVRVLTIESLVRRFGTPAFIKIDIEGYEDQALAGLRSAVPALSFEMTTIARDVARRCLDRLAELGYEGYDFSQNETMAFDADAWISKDRMLEHLLGLPHEANAGDVYAVRSMRAFTRQ